MECLILVGRHWPFNIENKINVGKGSNHVT